MRKRCISLLVCVSLLCSVVVATSNTYLGSLTYWYSISTDNSSGDLIETTDYIDQHKIGFWYDSPLVWTNIRDASSRDTTFVSAFNQGVSSAISQWNNALNVSMETTNNQNYANILFYGGTQDELNDTGLFDGFQSYTLGLTTYDGCIISEGYFTWSSIRKNCYSISYARSALVNRTAVYTARNSDDDATNDVSSTEITGYHVKTGIHEMGHALGYFGHDTFSTSVMRKGEYLNTTLNLRDTNHLEQVYTIMYEGG